MKGMYHLVLDDGALGAIDLRSRWQEQHYVFRHKNPFEVRDRWSAAQNATESALQRNSTIEADLGVPRPGYPPWAYFTGAALTWPSNWMAARYYFAVVDVLSLVILAGWAYREGVSAGGWVPILACAAVLATFSIHSTLGTGQYGIIVLVSLFAVLWFDEGNRPILSGLVLGIALIKPTISLPFLIPMLVKRRWKAVTVALLYILSASCVTWWLTGTNPLRMLRQMAGPFSLRSIQDGVDPVALLAKLNVKGDAAMRVSAVFVLIMSFALVFAWRRASMLTLFAIASVTARLWTYHRGYDDLIGLFLLLALGKSALVCRTNMAAAAFLVMGAALWLPARLLGTEVGILILTAWIGCAAVLLIVTPRTGPSNAPGNLLQPEYRIQGEFRGDHVQGFDYRIRRTGWVRMCGDALRTGLGYHRP